MNSTFHQPLIVIHLNFSCFKQGTWHVGTFDGHLCWQIGSHYWRFCLLAMGCDISPMWLQWCGGCCRRFMASVPWLCHAGTVFSASVMLLHLQYYDYAIVWNSWDVSTTGLRVPYAATRTLPGRIWCNPHFDGCEKMWNPGNAFWLLCCVVFYTVTDAGWWY